MSFLKIVIKINIFPSKGDKRRSVDCVSFNYMHGEESADATECWA